ncbi:MAG TPA: ABC transporter ATP-binding protein [Chloroflexia bacterium]|nr:ABC transporter ATP-binding protein [Chloroflexia bacterium]
MEDDSQARTLVIETRGLRKAYGPKLAVADLTLQVPRGEVFGFLGPNGAGKSTAVKMLLGLVRPDGGSASVLGHPPGHTTTMARIGFLPEHFRFHEWLSAREMLDLYGRLYGMSKEARARRIPRVLELVGLSEQSSRAISGFSKGMLQRIGLAQALLNDPELVVLDEPTSALDPFGRMLVRSVIHELKAAGTTVFLNSHLLGEVEATCDRVSFIREGVVLRTMSLHALTSGQLNVELRVDIVTPALLAALDRLTLDWRFADEDLRAATHSTAAPTGRGHGAAAAVAVAGQIATTLELTVEGEEALPHLAEQVIESGARLYALTPHKLSLEQIFLDVVGREDSGQ